MITLVEDEPSHTLQAHFAGELECYHNRAYATAYESWLTDIAQRLKRG